MPTSGSRYEKVAVGMGIRSQIGVRLFGTPQSQGAPNLYFFRVDAFENLESLSALFGHQAGVAISYAYEIGTLHEAVQSRTTIGTAVGIVMERYKLDDERAFAFLQRCRRTATSSCGWWSKSSSRTRPQTAIAPGADRVTAEVVRS